jgi:sulfite reductase (ferredoxin)
VADLGVEKIREMLKDYLPFPLQLPKDMPVTGYDSHLGWNEQGDGRYWYGISVENGRVKDDGAFRLRTALRTLISDLSCEVRLTAQQDILLCDLDHSALPKIEKILREHGVQLPGDVSNVQRYSLACPAIPTCSLAICESERTLPTVIDEMEVALKDLGLENEKFSIRMTGCPNGCVRPYTSDIGLVGRSGDKYLMFLGGRILGDRQNFQAKDLVPRAEIVSTLKPLLARFKHERTETESFGDYCHRLGQEQVKTLLTTGA